MDVDVETLLFTRFLARLKGAGDGLEPTGSRHAPTGYLETQPVRSPPGPPCWSMVVASGVLMRKSVSSARLS